MTAPGGFERVLRPARPVAQRCGGWHGPAETCPCHLQRHASGEPAGHEEQPVPAVVHDVLRGPGTPLDAAAQARMADRLGHDFSRVRIHAGTRAAESARAIGAVAYTAGQHVVLDTERAPLGPARDRLLAHELVHTVQQRGLPPGVPDRVGRADTAAERQADRAAAGVRQSGVAGLAVEPAAPTVARQPAPQWGVNLEFDASGRVTATVSGPSLPAVGNPTLGLRRLPDGRYHLVAGGSGRVIDAADVPALLRGLVHGAPSGGPRQAQWRVPPCAQLRVPDGSRYQRYDEYRVSQLLSPGWLPLTRPMYEAYLDSCQPEPPRPEPFEAVPPLLPPDQAFA
jgi:Domain of unknown function (DUF4157)